GEVLGGLDKEESMKFRPLHDRVVVKRVDAEEKTKGGIIIPNTAQEKPQEGEVIAVGPGGRDESGKLIPLDLKAGDRILFGKWSGTEIKLDGEDLLIMKESDVMGVIEGAPPPPRTAASSGAGEPFPHVYGVRPNVCQRSQVFAGRTGEDVPRRRYSRQ